MLGFKAESIYPFIMSRWFAKLFDLALWRPTWTLGLALGLLGLSLAQMPKLKIDLDLYGKEEQGIHSSAIFQEQRHRFQDVFSMVMIFAPQAEHRFTARDVCVIESWLEKQQSENPDLLSLASPLALRVAKREGERIWYRPILVPDCSRENAPLDLSVLLRSPWNEVVTDANTRDLGVEFTFRDDFDPKAAARLEEHAHAELADKIPGLEIYAVGSASFQAHLQAAFHRDLFLQGFVFLICLLGFRYFFGTWRAGAVFILTLVTTLLLVYGLMAFAGQPLDLLVNNLTLMTAIAGLEDFVFVAFEMKSARVDWRQAFRRLITPSFFTTLTTVAGFISLKASGLEMIGRFGIWAAVAALTEWVVLFLLMPSVFARVPALGLWINEGRAARPRWIVRLARLRPPRWVLPLAALLFIGGIYGFRHLNINEYPTHNFAASHIASKSYEYVSKTRGWENAIPVIFEHTDIHEQREHIERVLHQIEADDRVRAVESPFALEDFVAGDLGQSDASVPRLEIQSTPAFRRLFSGRDQARATVYLKSAELEPLRQIINKIESLCTDGFCSTGGQSVVYLEYADKIIPALLSSFTSSTLLVCALLILLAVRLRVYNYLALVYTALWGPIAMIGIMSLLQIPISLISSLFAAVIVGLTGDNGIQYLFAAKNGHLEVGVEERAESSVILCLLLAVSSLVFLLESVRPMQILGLLFFTGFIVNLAGDLWLLRGLLAKK